MTVVFRMSRAADGDMKHPPSLKKFLKRHHLPASRLVTGRQVHGARLVEVTERHAGRCLRGADVFATSVAGLPIGVFTADCVPVVLYAPNGKGAAVVHAGWRGARAGALRSALRWFRRKGIAVSALRAFIGAHIRVCCFETDWEVARRFSGARVRKAGRWFVDLDRFLTAELRAAGVRHGCITRDRRCTRDSRTCFSFRRGDQKRRMLTAAMIAS